MPSFETKHPVKHSANDMFELVADVEKYPQFVPLCEALRVRGRKTLEDGREVLVADMTVAYKLLRETFTTKVILDRAKSEIFVEYLDGPISELQNRWTFVPTGDDRCDVVFFIDYEFKSRTFARLVGAFFDRAFRKFSSAFEERADHVYGVA
ncbi:MAG: SRPBCC family protein [Pseudomonadota bacterium]